MASQGPQNPWGGMGSRSSRSRRRRSLNPGSSSNNSSKGADRIMLVPMMLVLEMGEQPTITIPSQCHLPQDEEEEEVDDDAGR